MRTISINLYQLHELTPKAQETAIEAHRQAIAHEPWDTWPLDDAKQIGVKIDGYDIDGGNYCNLRYVDDLEDVTNIILETHGHNADTYKAAREYWDEYQKLNSHRNEGSEDVFRDEWQVIKDHFTTMLRKAYLQILKNEHDDYFSDKTISETIEANEYEFFEDGQFYKESST